MIDDIGLSPVATDAGERLYRVVDAAYEKQSVSISSNLRPAGFGELMPTTLAVFAAGVAGAVVISNFDGLVLPVVLVGLAVVALFIAVGGRRTAFPT